MKPLLSGSSCLCYIDNNKVFATSFNLNLSTNVLKSTANIPMINDSYKLLKLSQKLAYRNFVSYDITVNCQITESFFNKMMIRLKQLKLNKKFTVKIVDNSNGLQYSFSDCFLSKMSLNVSKDSVATMDFSFLYFDDSFDIDVTKNTIKTMYDNPHDKGEVLMPYYYWTAQFGSILEDHIMSFSLQYNQNINTKTYCCGKNSHMNAYIPQKIISSIPVISYNISYMMAYNKKCSITGFYQSNDNNFFNDFKDVSIIYKNKKYISISKCSVDTFNFQLGQFNSVNTFNLSGIAYGIYISQN